jgi:hypothetical protein
MPEPWFPDRKLSRAVLIGASTFQSSDLPDLPAVAHNLNALQQVLTDAHYGVIDQCRDLVNDQVADAKVGAAIADAAREATDLLLVYYAGHGVLDDDGRLHLARPDTSLDHIGWTSLSVDLLKRDLVRARARARVLVLDCCFSGRAVTAMTDPRSLVAGQLALSGTYTLTSTTATAPSHAPPGKRYTSFTNALLGALAQPDPLTLDEIYRRISAELDALGLPRPQHNATDDAATLALTRGPVLAYVTPPPPPHTPAPPPVTQHVFTTVRPPSFMWSRVATMPVVAGVAAGFRLADTSWDPSVLPWTILAWALFTSIMLLAVLRVSKRKGKLEVHQHCLSVHWPQGRPTHVVWQQIHQIRVVPVDRPRLSTPRCIVQIELDPTNHVPLGGGLFIRRGQFTRVPNRERPTYRFGEVDTSSDRLAAALQQHLPQRTRTG